MIDVHCHLQFQAFEEDYQEVVKRAFEAGVTGIVNVGTKLDSSQKAVEFAEKYEQMYAVVGIHPHHADKLSENSNSEIRNTKQIQISNNKNSKLINTEVGGWFAELEQMARHPKVIGIGEVGLDYFSYQSNKIVDPKKQKEIFEKQIELAYSLKLPLQIHNRQAGEDILEILNYNKNSLSSIPGMFHCFSGSMEVLKGALDLGFYIGFDGNVTYKGLAPGENTDLKDLVNYTPLDRLLIETDSPFLPPIPFRGKRNEPANVVVTGKFIAELKGISFQTLVDQTTKNVYTVFSKLK